MLLHNIGRVRRLIPLSLLLLISSLQFVYAQGTSADTAVGVGVFVVFVIFIIGYICFWLWMLIDCIQNYSRDQALWLLIILFAGLIGSLIYFFVVRRPRVKGKKVAPRKRSKS